MTDRPQIEQIAVELAAVPRPLDPACLFGAPGPVELEVGIGKGGFLLAQAKARPGVNFLGVEWANEYFKFAADRFARWGLANVRVIRTDAQALVEAWLAPACLAAVHVYFPDPWPKRRHHKRRFFRPRTVEAVVRVLAPGGQLYVATDHAEYFAVIEELLRARQELAEVPFPAGFAQPGEIAGTNFERKYAREGRTFYRLAMRRQGANE